MQPAAGQARFLTVGGRIEVEQCTAGHPNAKSVVTTPILPDPKALFMAHVRSEPLYVSCAFDGNCVYIITVHRYDSCPLARIDQTVSGTNARKLSTACRLMPGSSVIAFRLFQQRIQKLLPVARIRAPEPLQRSGKVN